MVIRSAKFIKGVIGTDEIFTDGTPQIAFIGRSNVGKSSVINSLVNQKDLAITSSFPGRTQQINVFLINKSFYLMDLPGYGFAKLSKEKREWITKMITWYFFTSSYNQDLIVLIIDAKVGPTNEDLEMIAALEKYEKNLVVVANKIDKISKPEWENQLAKIQSVIKNQTIIPYSAEKKIGIELLSKEIEDVLKVS